MLDFLKYMFAAEPRGSQKAPTSTEATAPKPPQQRQPPKTLQRAELIREALEVHRAKRRILDDLSDESRAKLLAMAVLGMLNQGKAPDRKE